MNAPFRLDGRIALITGGASGIGEATCRIFAAAGALVYIADIDRDRAERLASELPGSRALICDVTDERAVKEMFTGIPQLDILVNNAGIGLVGGIEETDLADYERLFRVNVQSIFLVTRAAMPLLLASHGVVVNIASAAGLIGVKRRFAYCATKGAVIAMTRQLAVDYPTQLRVNCICPGTVDTPFVEAYLEKYHKHEKEKVRAELNQRQPVGRLGRPEEIGYMALYLASPEAEFITGAALPIDGGWTAA
jgi:NAD(P)-dependent dehydrogenase (short-subunit alcohol dehydrogenase family)